METKFTDGPWVKCHRGETLVGKNEKQVGIYDCGLVNVNKSDEAVANAHLIAAAPDMYNQLVSLRKMITKACLDGQCTEELLLSNAETSKILTKARGEK